MIARVDLPDFIKKNTNISNPMSTNNMCFWNCIAFHESKNEKGKIAKLGKQKFEEFYGMKPKQGYAGIDEAIDVPAWEEKNQIGISIYTYDENTFDSAKPLLTSCRISEKENTINLLRVGNHYCYIRDVKLLLGTKHMCKKCGHRFRDKTQLQQHNSKVNCDTDILQKQEIKNIKKTIANCKNSDKQKLKIIGNIICEDVIRILHDQNYKCYLCNEVVLTHSYVPYCHYKFSIDRLKNEMPHDRDNCKISCYFCNCQGHFLFDATVKRKCYNMDCQCNK